VATKQQSQGVEDVTTAYKSFFFDLPIASVKWGLGIGGEKDAVTAAWKGYDASVRMATAAIDALYRNPLFSDVFSRTLSTMLRWQQIGNAVSGTVFTSLWKVMGVPTADEVQALAEQLRGLEHRLSQMAHTKDVQTRPAPGVRRAPSSHCANRCTH
jgi:hypothetical protein